jgi:hypothetical protein
MNDPATTDHSPRQGVFALLAQVNPVETRMFRFQYKRSTNFAIESIPTSSMEVCAPLHGREKIHNRVVIVCTHWKGVEIALKHVASLGYDAHESLREYSDWFREEVVPGAVPRALVCIAAHGELLQDLVQQHHHIIRVDDSKIAAHYPTVFIGRRIMQGRGDYYLNTHSAEDEAKLCETITWQVLCHE